MAGRLVGRVAVITGAGRGIGAATALRFAAEGAAVCLADRDAAPLRSVVDGIVARGGPAAAVVGDCADPAVAQRVADTAASQLGGLDIVVNNAGSAADRMFGDLDQHTWDGVHRDGLGATLAVSQACLVHLRATATEELSRTGRVAHQRRITNTVASAALTGSPGGAALSATGGAIAALTRTLARELGGYGVNVNAVAVGFVETRLSAPQTAEDPASGVAESIRQMTKAMTALGRHGTPADVAAVHAFLASGDADFVTGAVIPVTGGLLGTL